MIQNDKFKINWDDELDLIKITLDGKLDIEDAKECVAGLREMIKIAEEKGIKYVDCIANTRNVGLTTDKEFREVFINFLKEDRLKHSIAALWGIGSMQKMVVNFLGGLSKTTAFKCLDTEEEAIKWIKEARKKREE